MNTYLIVLLSVSTTLVVIFAGLLAIMMMGVYNTLRQVQAMVELQGEVQASSGRMAVLHLRTLLRYEANLARWYQASTGENWLVDPETAGAITQMEIIDTHVASLLNLAPAPLTPSSAQAPLATAPIPEPAVKG